MKTHALATIYLDNANIGLMGDPRPSVSKIIAASGKQPGSVSVTRTQSSTDSKGQLLRMEDIIDRTVEPTRPIYLRSRPNAVSVDLPDKPAPSSSAFIESPAAGDAGPKRLGDPLPNQLPDDSVVRGGRRA